jgi:hypothetical protein
MSEIAGHSAVGIIRSEGPLGPELLLERRPSGLLLYADRVNLFGGTQEPGETAQECFEREAGREELVAIRGGEPLPALPFAGVDQVWEGPVAGVKRDGRRIIMGVTLFSAVLERVDSVELHPDLVRTGTGLVRVPAEVGALPDPESYIPFVHQALVAYRQGNFSGLPRAELAA